MTFSPLASQGYAGGHARIPRPRLGNHARYDLEPRSRPMSLLDESERRRFTAEEVGRMVEVGILDEDEPLEPAGRGADRHDAAEPGSRDDGGEGPPVARTGLGPDITPARTHRSPPARRAFPNRTSAFAAEPSKTTTTVIPRGRRRAHRRDRNNLPPRRPRQGEHLRPGGRPRLLAAGHPQPPPGGPQRPTPY